MSMLLTMIALPWLCTVTLVLAMCRAAGGADSAPLEAYDEADA